MQSSRVRWNRLLILVCGIIGVLLICCIGIWALAPNLRRIISAPFWKTDTQLTAEAAHKFVDYDLPPNYQELKVLALRDEYAAVIIAHRERPEDRIYIVGLLQGILEVEEWRTRYEENLSKEMGDRRYTTQVIGTQATTVRGQPTVLRLFEGTDEAGRNVRQVVCAFKGKKGDVLLAIVAGRENWDQTMAESFLRSIR